jgi:hypothetical protein
MMALFFAGRSDWHNFKRHGCDSASVGTVAMDFS